MQTPETDSYTQDLKAKLVKAMPGFSSDFPDDLDPYTMEVSSPNRTDFPVPELLLMLLRNLMGWSWSGHGEKVRWTVYGSVDGAPIGFELRKFGLRILYTDDPKPNYKSLVGRLHAGLRVLESVLAIYAKGQLNVGNLSIENRHAQFENRYRFFRWKADKSFKKADPARVKKNEKKKRKRKHGKSTGEIDGGIFSLTDGINKTWRARSAGFYYSAAMVDAYFSCLEHQAILLRAFTGQAMQEGDVLDLINAKWDTKLKGIIDFDQDYEAGICLGRMRQIKARVRNPFAHGGMENDGASLMFHVPNLGALPANLSAIKDSVQFSFFPIEENRHSDICATFDDLDTLLRSSELEGPYRLMNAGIDPSFDADTLAKYAGLHRAGTDALEQFIDRWAYEWERHANMDY